MLRSQGDINAAVAVLVINQKYSVISEQRHCHRTVFFNLFQFSSTEASSLPKAIYI
jgi:hypothetical protein